MFGGIETMLVNIANAQAQLGANVYIIIINDNCDSTLISALNENVKIIFCIVSYIQKERYSYLSLIGLYSKLSRISFIYTIRTCLD